MHDLREDLDPVWRAANRLGASHTDARSILLVACHAGEGTTSMAASLACIAARRTDKPAWLVDLDLKRNPVLSGFEKGFARDVGRPGRAYDASLRQTPIYTVTPAADHKRQSKLLTAHEIEGLSLLVTRFRNERLASGQTVQLQASPKWWQALRRISGWTIVDAPALERSSAALTMASQVDGVVLIVEADRTTAREVDSAARELEASGARLMGTVLNRVGADARLADRFSA
ncbi:MAG: hypothetical protein AAGB16_04210 [Pseudomonadota bacterium]